MNKLNILFRTQLLQKNFKQKTQNFVNLINYNIKIPYYMLGSKSNTKSRSKTVEKKTQIKQISDKKILDYDEESKKNQDFNTNEFLDKFAYKSSIKKKRKTQKKKIELEYEQEEEEQQSFSTKKLKISTKSLKSSYQKSEIKDEKKSKTISKAKKSKNKNIQEDENENSQDENSEINSSQENDEEYDDEGELVFKTKKNKKYNCRENYEEILAIIEEMRKDRNAPVDTQGAGMQSDPNQPKNIRDFQVLTSLLLSVQTKDETTDMVTKRLVAGGFSAKQALEMTDAELKEKIYEVNFNSKKVNYIKKCAKIIEEDYKGKIPNDYKIITSWPGIGPKVANLFLQIANNQVQGISVDTHLHRISNRLGFVVTNTPEQTMNELQKFVDKQYWGRINPLIVGLGQTICKPQNPDCKNCLLNKKCEEGRRRMVGRKKI